MTHADPIVALKSIACLRYQSCEHPDYDKSIGAQLLDALERHMISLLPGYDDAPWGWTRPKAPAPAPVPPGLWPVHCARCGVVYPVRDVHECRKPAAAE